MFGRLVCFQPFSSVKCIVTRRTPEQCLSTVGFLVPGLHVLPDEAFAAKFAEKPHFSRVSSFMGDDMTPLGERFLAVLTGIAFFHVVEHVFLQNTLGRKSLEAGVAGPWLHTRVFLLVVEVEGRM